MKDIFNSLTDLLSRGFASDNIIHSLIFILALYLLKVVSAYFLIRKTKTAYLKLKRRHLLNNIFWLVLIFGLFFIWSNEIKTLVLSLVAVLVAIVLATKELILCLTGTAIKAISKAFSLGDRIIVIDLRGDVISQTWLSTTLYEIGPGEKMHQYTGRTICLPNSIFVNNAVINESYEQDFVLHSFTITVSGDIDFEDLENKLLTICKQECSSYMDEARANLERAIKKQSLTTAKVEPRVSLSISDVNKVDVIIRVPAPFRQKGMIEQKIIKTYLKQKNQAA